MRSDLPRVGSHGWRREYVPSSLVFCGQLINKNRIRPDLVKLLGVTHKIGLNSECAFSKYEPLRFPLDSQKLIVNPVMQCDD